MVGDRAADLRRHQLDQPRQHADLVSLGSAEGILLGTYIWTHAIGKRFSAMGARLATAIADGERVHPGYAHKVDQGVSVAWSKVPFTKGSWVDWADAGWRDAYQALLEASGPFYFAGERIACRAGRGLVHREHTKAAWHSQPGACTPEPPL